MTNYDFANRLAGISPSPTLQMSRKAKEMAAHGMDVLDLSVGEPDFPTPEFITTAAKSAIDTGLTSFYTPTLGIFELRQTIAEQQQSENPLNFKNVAVAAGAKLILATIYQILISDKEKVAVAAPYWVSYSQQAKLVNGDFYAIYPQNSSFKLNTADLDQLDFVPKVLIINNPTNPTGAVYSKSELIDIIEWCNLNGVFLISDEIYSKLVYNETRFTSVLDLTNVKDSKIIVVNGISKAYSMTGWRIGWAIADEKIISKMGEVLDHFTSNPATVSQYAALAALNGDGISVEKMRQTFEKRLNFVKSSLQNIPELKLAVEPKGAFYCFIKVSPEFLKSKKLSSTDELAMDLLEKKQVALAAGEGFGMPGYLRLSYAKDESILQKAILRIKEYFEHGG